MAMGSENLRPCRRAIRVIAIVALLFGVLDGVLQQQTYLTAAERTRTKLLEAVAAGKELHGVRPHKLGDEWVYVLQLEPDFATARMRWNFRNGKNKGTFHADELAMLLAAATKRPMAAWVTEMADAAAASAEPRRVQLAPAGKQNQKSALLALKAEGVVWAMNAFAAKLTSPAIVDEPQRTRRLKAEGLAWYKGVLEDICGGPDEEGMATRAECNGAVAAMVAAAGISRGATDRGFRGLT
jgi:hypothetical protein